MIQQVEALPVKNKLAHTELLARAREMIEILAPLNMDIETLQAAVLFLMHEAGVLSDEQLAEKYGENLAKLVASVVTMNAIGAPKVSENSRDAEPQIDNIRKMLLAMVEDVRAVVIKLAERVCLLRAVKNADEETRVLLAREIADIYAPLANRLGIGQLKWELEDISFRYFHPTVYKDIAKQLDGKRVDREVFIDKFVTQLQARLDKDQIRAKVYGRPKHIYSIWRKMKGKDLKFDELFDVRAVRIVTERLQDCYGALGVVHDLWHHIPREFDDYVANPKPNGYQSIHTVVVGLKAKLSKFKSAPKPCIKILNLVWLHIGSTKKVRVTPNKPATKKKLTGYVKFYSGKKMWPKVVTWLMKSAARYLKTESMYLPLTVKLSIYL
ncbi:HD domain-containing protein [Paucibacter sp. O1-1]|nr:HD domain-containing protein [Paucibacter sp. O1-1]MDA3824470.1 HD domain-containing protein [Paucibacter sp. O1-1]